MNVCTVIAKNYVAQARVLARSFRRHHPDGRFTVLVLDDFDGFIDPAQEPFEVMRTEDLELPQLLQMASSYDILELSTAVKPWLLRRLLRDRDHVVYLDPDIRIYASCEPIAELAREHGMVLTPHNVAAMPRDGLKPSEQDILVAGVYNLGFIALAEHPDTHEFLDWWSERLLYDCIVDPDRGYFVDQRWIDLVPGMVPSVHFLRDPGYNVAYWNLATRDVQRTGPEDYTVNGSPLRFFHFSGYDPERPDTLSKHQNRIDLAALPVVRELCDGYGAELLAEGYEEARGWPYTYTHTASGLEIDRAVRRTFVDGMSSGALAGSLFTPEGEAEFRAYASGPAGEDHLERLSRYLWSVWAVRRDLSSSFNLNDDRGVDILQAWARDHGRDALGPRVALLRPIEQPGAADTATPLARAQDGRARRFGVNVAGFLRSELGVGEVARQAIGALDAVDVPVMPSSLVAHLSRQGHDFGASSGLAAPFAVNLLCMNADTTPGFAHEAGEAFFAGRHTIGWWWWEVSAFPEMWRGSFDYVDELWAGSEFVAQTLRAAGDVPVVHVRMPVTVPEGVTAARERLGLPDGFVFLFVYDYNSVLERKNPVGLIEAFRRAFPPGAGPSLVLKSINAQNHPGAHERVVQAAGGHPDVHLIDGYVSAADRYRMIASCDCYVSLHRSEGFGITMAEAMLFGRPVIATGYSGNVDFMTPENSYLVDHELVPIGPGADPYPAEGEWADPDLDHAAELMRRVVEQPEEAARRAEAGRRFVAEHHSPKAAGLVMRDRLHVLSKTAAPGDLDGSRARQEAGELAQRGPAEWTHPRLSPRRLLRAAVLRLARPLQTYQREVDAGLLWAVQETAEAERAEAQAQQAELLTQLRRLERRLAALEQRDQTPAPSGGAGQQAPAAGVVEVGGGRDAAA